MRTCSCCGKYMFSGFVTDCGMEYYCSKDCLEKAMTFDEYLNAFENDEMYWTEWEDDYMNYCEFVDSVAKIIGDNMPEFEVSSKNLEKLQGEGYYGVYIKHRNENIGVCLNISYWYDKYEDEEVSIDDVAKHVAVDAVSATPVKIDLESVRSIENVLEHTIIQVVPVSGNEVILGNSPHVVFGDIAAVFRYVVENSEDKTVSFVITNDFADGLKVGENDLCKMIIENAEKNNPMRVRRLNEVISELLGIEADDGSDSGIYVADCKNGIFGAGCMMYPGFTEAVMKKVGGSFYVLPSSIYEVLAVKDEGLYNTEFFRSMVRGINISEVLPKDRLSDNVYHYDCETGVFEMI